MNCTLHILSTIWQTRARFYALFLLCLAVSSPVYGGVESRKCDFRKLADYRAESKRMKEQLLYSGQNYLDLVSNKPFVERAYLMEEQPGRIFFHVENAVLKTLNDKVFGDKELSAATLNAYKTEFFRRLINSDLADVLVSVEFGGAYNDFKSVRLEFDTSSKFAETAVVEKIENLRKQVAEDFSSTMREFPRVAQAYRESGNPILKDPAKWHEFGLGHTAAKSYLKARMRRNSDYRGKTEKYLVFNEADATRVAEDLRLVDQDRGVLAQLFDDRRLFANGLPTPELIDILRIAETAPEIITHHDYREFVRAFIQRRFQLNIRDNAPIDRLQRYFRLGNELAATIYTENQEPMGIADLRGVTHGIWGLDMTGQNKRNLEGVFASLHFAYSEMRGQGDDMYLVEGMLRTTTRRQQIESAKFLGFADFAKQTMLKNQIIRLEDGLGIQGTGDDFTIRPSIDLPDAVRSKTLDELANNSTQGSLFRSTIQLQKYTDGSPIPREERLTLLSEAENLEKQLRRNVEGSILQGFIPEKDLREVMVSVLIRPVSEGKAIVDFEIAYRKGAAHPARVKMTMDKILSEIHKTDTLPTGWSPGEVRSVDKMLDENR